MTAWTGLTVSSINYIVTNTYKSISNSSVEEQHIVITCNSSFLGVSIDCSLSELS